MSNLHEERSIQCEIFSENISYFPAEVGGELTLSHFMRLDHPLEEVTFQLKVTSIHKSAPAAFLL